MVWLLLILFQIKHFLADYPLQGKFMLGKFKPHPDYILPLLAHVLVHGGMTFMIAVFFKTPTVALLIALFDAGIHFLVDRVKASPEMLGRFKPLTKETYVKAVQDNDQAAIKSNTLFWWSLGLDQMVHHLTHYAIIWMLL